MSFVPTLSDPAPPAPGTKYRPLYEYLRRQTDEEVILSFRAMECLIKRLLPKAAREPGWWALSDSTGTHPSACWFAAGFEAHLCATLEAVAFQRVAPLARVAG